MALTWMGGLAPIAPDFVLLLGALTVLVTDLLLRPRDKAALFWGTITTLLLALVATVVFDLQGEALGGAYRGDHLALFIKRIVLASAGLAALGAKEHLEQVAHRRQGEYWLMLLFSVLGMSLLSGTQDVLLLAVCFELMGIPLYVLAAFARTSDRGTEGALKLYLIGAVSSATLLYGLSLLFGMAGTTSLTGIALYVAAHPSPVVMVGLALTLAGTGFKLGVFPFHMWVPDTYQGSWTPFVVFLSTAPKLGGMVVLIQLLLAGSGALWSGAWVVLVMLSGLTLVTGSLLAINQDQLKRLLGYSGVAHAGFTLMALAASDARGLAALLFYALVYLFTTAGAFLVIHAVERAGGDGSVHSLDGLARRSGFLGMAMLVFLLSLAGIPFVGGFWAKLLVFVAVWASGLGWLVLLAALVSVLALVYYLRLVRAMFMNDPVDLTEPQVDWGTNVAIGICLVFVVGLGLFPGTFLDAAQAAAVSFLGL